MIATDVERKLKTAWRKERRIVHVRGLCIAAVWLVALLLLTLVVDYLFALPGPGRTLLLLCNAATLAYVVRQRWWRALNDYDPVRVALQVERQHPELQSILVSYVQFSGSAPDGASVELLEAMNRRAVTETGPIDFREIINLGELKRVALFSLGVLLVFGLVSVNWRKHMQVMMVRLFNPLAEVQYPTRTKLKFLSEPIRTVKQGELLEILVQADGRIPAEGRLTVWPEDSEELERIAMPRGEENVYSYRRTEAFKSFRYQVRLGDAESEIYTVTVIPPPQVVQAKVTLTYPKYTGMKPRLFSTLNLTDVLEGATLQWSLAMSHPLRSGVLVFDTNEDRPLAMTIEAAGKSATVTHVPESSVAYRFRWVRQGFEYLYQDPVRYVIRTVPDAVPRVDLIYPKEDQKATLRKRLRLRAAAEDDFGLSEVWLVYSRSSEENAEEPGKEKRIRLPLAEPGKTRAAQIEYEWRLEDVAGLEIGDQVAYSLEAADNRKSKGSKPQRIRSRTQYLYIVGKADYLAWVLEQRMQLAETLKTIRDDEQQGKKQVQRLLRQSGKDQ